MSLGISDTFVTTSVRQGNFCTEGSEELAQLTRYLTVLEENKKAASFVPDDAMMALDMAGFVRNRLCGGRAASGSSLARMALALMHTRPAAPAQ